MWLGKFSKSWVLFDFLEGDRMLDSGSFFGDELLDNFKVGILNVEDILDIKLKMLCFL